MNNIEKIKAEIERLQDGLMDANGNFEFPERQGAYTVLCDLDAFVDKLLEEPVSEDLDGARTTQVVNGKVVSGTPQSTEFTRGFEAGSQWKEQQFEQNRLAACDRQTKDEAEREVAFVESILLKENREPTYSDAIEYGMKLKEQQMLKDAIICKAYNPDIVGIVEILPGGLHLNPEKFKAGDIVKVIVIKDE